MPVQRLVQRKTIPRKWIERLSDSPKFQAPDGSKGWNGYFNHMDKTLLPFSVLTSPSVNCTMPSWDKVVPDMGKTLLGQSFTENTGIIGHKQNFTNASGIQMETRVFASGNSNLKDVVEVFFDNRRLVVWSVIIGTFQVGETVVGIISGANGTIVSIVGVTLTLEDITGVYIYGEAVRGSQSGATSTVNSVPISKWNQITESNNPLPRGAHEYYFDEWFDTKELSTIPNSLPGKTIQRMVWTNGYQDPITKKGLVYSWTGGIALITVLTGSTLTIDSSTTWRSLGFTEDRLGVAYVIVNGTSYTVTAGLDTNTISVSTITSGINIGDYAFSKIETDVSPVPFDVCKAYHGYMYYGNWNQKKLFQSNGFNRDYNYLITFFQALDNDIQINMASPYTDENSQHLYNIVVKSVNPDITTQTLTGSGLNDAIFITSGYNLNDGLTHVHKVLFVGDYSIVSTGGLIEGETITGASSDAKGIIIAEITVGSNMLYGVKLLTTQGFNPGETVQGNQTAGPFILSSAPGNVIFQDWIQYTRDNVITDTTTDYGPHEKNPINIYPIALSNLLSIQFTNLTGHTIGNTFELDIRRGGHDTFNWSKDGVIVGQNIPMTSTGFTPLSDGVEVSWIGVTGHAVGDFWNITAYPKVDRAFDNFYYNNNRLVGEGYIYTLPSNFWTMDTQEEELYVNGTYGEWTVVKTTITSASATTTSEVLSATPLKQSGSNKVLFPYLTGHMNNELVYVTTDKKLDMLSRVIAVEKPQVSYLSDAVKFDFDKSSFIGGRIKYHNKRLYISSPKEGITHCYDFFRSYWQAPKTFPEVGVLSIIGGNLVCHSNTRNQSFTMFTSLNGDNGADYTVEIRTPYTAHGARWGSKFSNISFTEGYIEGAPQLIHTVYVEPNGCGGILPHTLEPNVCLAPDRSPFGEGSFGSHPFGSDTDNPGNYFKEVWKQYSPVIEWYFMSIGITCSTKSHTYSILSLAMNSMTAPSGNNKFVAPSNLAE